MHQYFVKKESFRQDRARSNMEAKNSKKPPIEKDEEEIDYIMKQDLADYRKRNVEKVKNFNNQVPIDI